MRRAVGAFVFFVLTVAAAAAVSAGPPEAADSEPRAIEIARAVLDRIGGEEGWAATRFVRWKFFGGRQHYWDKQTGDVRIEMAQRLDDDGKVQRPKLLVLMNVQSKTGRVWADDDEVRDAEKLEEYLTLGHEIWINDSYWMFLPFKLLDPGVTLKYAGEREMEDGRMADVLDLTFGDGVGYTPENRYEVFVARDSGLIEQWAFFSSAEDDQPKFTLPWADWRKYGRIWLATDHGQQKNWDIAVHAVLPRSVFTE